MNVSTLVAELVGDARGRLLEEVVRVDRPRSIRRWAAASGVNHAHAASLLREFEDLGLVRSDRVGRSVVVVAEPRSLLRQHLQRILALQFQVPDVAREAAQGLPDGVDMYLFGSAARGNLREGSDIDLCVIGPESEATEAASSEVAAVLSAAFPLPVNVLRFTPPEWEQARRDGERIVSEVLSGVRLTRDL